MKTTTVSLLFDLVKREKNSRQDRDVFFYLEKGKFLLSQNTNLMLFIEPNCLEKAIEIRKSYLGEEYEKKTCFIPFYLEEESEYYKQYFDLIKSKKTPDGQNAIKDSYYFTLIMYMKFECLKKAIQLNPFETDYFNWCDFGIGHVIMEKRHEENSYTLCNAFSDKIKIMCIVPVFLHEIEHDHVWYKQRACRNAGGFWTGKKQLWFDLINLFEKEIDKCFTTGYAALEEQILSKLSFVHPHLFDFYYGDYYSILCNYFIAKENLDIVMFGWNLLKNAKDIIRFEHCTAFLLQSIEKEPSNWSKERIEDILKQSIEFFAINKKHNCFEIGKWMFKNALLSKHIKHVLKNNLFYWNQQFLSFMNESDFKEACILNSEEYDPILIEKLILEKHQQLVVKCKYTDYKIPIMQQCVMNNPWIQIDQKTDECVLLICDAVYYSKAIRTIEMIRTAGNFMKNIVLITDDSVQLDSKTKQKWNIMHKVFPKISTDYLVEQIKTHPFKNSDQREYTKLFQWHKLYSFHPFMKQWKTVLYLDSGTCIFDSIQHFFHQKQSKTILAMDDAFPEFEKKFSCQLELSNTNVIDSLKEICDLNSNYFLNCVYLYNTDIIKKNTFADLIECMKKYPVCRTNEMGVMNIYFHFLKKQWKPFELLLSNGKQLFDWTERDNKTHLNYIALKYPHTFHL